MDIDASGTLAAFRRSSKGRAPKRRSGKASSSIAFPVYSKGKKIGLRRKPRK